MMEATLESLENALQIAVLSICAIYTAFRALSSRGRTWVLLFSFFGSFLLGDLYWLVCLLYFGDKPQIAVVSDLSWYAAYLFLFLLIKTAVETNGTEGGVAKACKRSFLPYLAPVFTAAMAIFYIREGNVLSNIIYAVIMGLLLFSVVKALLPAVGEKNSFLPFLVTVFIFCLLEYAMWTVSCFSDRMVFRYAYCCFDLMLTLSFPCFIIMLKLSEKQKSTGEVRP